MLTIDLYMALRFTLRQAQSLLRVIRLYCYICMVHHERVCPQANESNGDQHTKGYHPVVIAARLERQLVPLQYNGYIKHGEQVVVVEENG